MIVLEFNILAQNLPTQYLQVDFRILIFSTIDFLACEICDPNQNSYQLLFYITHMCERVTLL